VGFEPTVPGFGGLVTCAIWRAKKTAVNSRRKIA